MAVLVNLDGELYPRDEARISVFDHGFLYGDSVYETLRTYGGRCFHLERHLERLERSASLIGLTLPRSGRDWIGREVERTVTAAGNSESAIRVTVTRGEGQIGIDPGLCAAPSLVVIVRALEPLPSQLYEEGVSVVLARTVRNSPRALDPNIKSGNFLNNILAKREAVAAGAFEAVMMNHEGCVAEASQSNVFAVLAETVVTPGGGAGLLQGITRQLVLDLCREGGIAAVERDLFVGELYAADEVFLTSTLKGILPVIRIGRQTLGDGRPGPITRRLMELYAERAEQFGSGRSPA